MTKILTKEGAKRHLVNQSDQPLCFGFNRGSRATWTGYEIQDMLLSRWWAEDEKRCHNCASIFRLWAFTQFKEQVIDFISKSGLSDFPIEILKGGSWHYSNVSRWPDAKIIKGDGYKRR
jgi:hypothetical protein